MVTGPSKPLAAVVPILLSLNAGYVDTAGFIALHGLFTAHVTGNFVTIGAATVFGTTGVVTKLFALPTFCITLLALRLLHFRLANRGWPVLRALLGFQFLMLGLGAILAIGHGPFPSGDDWPAMVTGLLLVVGMATQNGAHRVHLSNTPPSTMMTGTTTQIMLDLGDLMHGTTPEERDAIRARLARMGQAVIAFATGCAAAALLFATLGNWCFALPPLLVLAACLHPGTRT